MYSYKTSQRDNLSLLDLGARRRLKNMYLTSLHRTPDRIQPYSKGKIGTDISPRLAPTTWAWSFEPDVGRFVLNTKKRQDKITARRRKSLSQISPAAFTPNKNLRASAP